MTAPWEYRDPLEPTLAAEVSSATLMAHVRVIGALERESGSPGEAQAFDYIERTLKSYGMEVERREIEAYISLPQEARLALQQAGALGHVHVLGDHLHNMIMTTNLGHAGAGHRRADPRHPVPVDPRRRRRAAARPARERPAARSPATLKKELLQCDVH